MKKYLTVLAVVVVLLVAGFSAAAGLSATTRKAGPAAPQGCTNGPADCFGGAPCQSNWSSLDRRWRCYAGYLKFAAPAAGASISGNVKLVSDTLAVAGNSVSGWIGVNNSGFSRWIQAGVYDYGGSPQKYVEYNTGTDHQVIAEGAASYGASYAVTILHVSGTIWKATVAGSSLQVDVGMTGYESQFLSESQDQSSTVANSLDIWFSSVAPWTTAPSQMSQYVNSPSYVQNVTSNGWESGQ